MDFELPPDDDPRRTAVRTWLAEHPAPSGRDLAEAGLVAPHWPAPWGRGADPVHQLVIDDELARAGVRRPVNPIGIGWAGPTVLLAGTAEQKERYLLPLLAGEELWCQLFSEPGAGSDLASLTTRAVRDGDEWVVNGQKIWTSLAQFARFGILIARTDPGLPKHRGISYFVCPMDLPGITIRPIVEMTGAQTFNEVFFDGVRLPAANLVGAEGDGWNLAKVTLGNERGVAVLGRGHVGHGTDGRGPARPGPVPGWRGRPRPAPAAGRAAHRGGDPPAHPPPHGDRRGMGPRAGPGGVDPQGAGRRARPARVRPGQGLVGAAGMLADGGPLGLRRSRGPTVPVRPR